MQTTNTHTPDPVLSHPDYMAARREYEEAARRMDAGMLRDSRHGRAACIAAHDAAMDRLAATYRRLSVA